MPFALSIRQPWAWLIVNGYKPIENRNWSTKRRGLFFVHASRKFDFAGYSWVNENFPEIPLPLPKEFLLGGIVGLAHIVTVCTDSTSKWFTGKYGFVLDFTKPLPFEEMKGKLGFFSIPQTNKRAEQLARPLS